jgi:hypothetical protein
MGVAEIAESTYLKGCPHTFVYIPNKNRNATWNTLKYFTELQFISGNQSIEINTFGPNLWILHDLAGAQPRVGLGSQVQLLRRSFSPQKGFITVLPNSLKQRWRKLMVEK